MDAGRRSTDLGVGAKKARWKRRGRPSTDLEGGARMARWKRGRGRSSCGGAGLFYLNVPW